MALAHAWNSVRTGMLNLLFNPSNEATLETMEIVLDMDQLSMMLSSLEEARQQDWIFSDQAFADLGS